VHFLLEHLFQPHEKSIEPLKTHKEQALGLTITSQISCDDLGQCVAAGDGCFANFVALKKVEPFLSMEKLL
jgi:hypothetical protein